MRLVFAGRQGSAVRRGMVPSGPMLARLGVLVAILALTVVADAFAHGVAAGDKGYIQQTLGVRIVPFMYLGAKHMVTGYDHLLFLLGVIFYLYKLRDIGVYVTLFAIGHSATLLIGVLTGVSVSAYIIDAIIGFSVVYKALDNIGAFEKWFGFQPNTKVATMVFGLFHGLGLATKLLDFKMDQNGLLANLVSFNIGVELGQLLALGAILAIMTHWRRSENFSTRGYAANVVIMTAGFVLVGYQLVGYAVSRSTV